MNDDLIFSIKKQFETPLPKLMQIGNILEIIAFNLFLQDEKESSDEIRDLVKYLNKYRDIERGVLND